MRSHEAKLGMRYVTATSSCLALLYGCAMNETRREFTYVGFVIVDEPDPSLSSYYADTIRIDASRKRAIVSDFLIIDLEDCSDGEWNCFKSSQFELATPTDWAKVGTTWRHGGVEYSLMEESSPAVCREKPCLIKGRRLDTPPKNVWHGVYWYSDTTGLLGIQNLFGDENGNTIPVMYVLTAPDQIGLRARDFGTR